MFFLIFFFCLVILKLQGWNAWAPLQAIRQVEKIKFFTLYALPRQALRLDSGLRAKRILPLTVADHSYSQEFNYGKSKTALVATISDVTSRLEYWWTTKLFSHIQLILTVIVTRVSLAGYGFLFCTVNNANAFNKKRVTNWNKRTRL